MGASDTAVSLQLPAILDMAAATPLAAELLALRRHALTLDASQVERVGGLCLQVLLSARRTWAADNAFLAIEPTSPAFENAMALFGAHDLVAFRSAHP